MVKKEIYNISKTPVIADDSGLCLEAYNGWPGGLTQRFAGEEASDEERNNIFCLDMDLITGRGIEGFQVPCMWPTVPYGYLFSTGIEDFIPCYKKSAKVLGGSRMKDIQIKHSENNLNLRLFY